MKNKGYAKFFVGGGGGGGGAAIKVDYGIYFTFFSISRSFWPFYADNPDYFRRFSKISEDSRRCPKNLQTLNRIFSRNTKPHSDLQNPTHESKKY